MASVSLIGRRIEQRIPAGTLASFLLIIGLLACSSRARPLPLQSAPSFEAGFQVFPSPRTFDPPGTIFRVDGDGIRRAVVDLSGLLKISPREEAIPKLSLSGAVGAETYFSWLGASRASVGLARTDTAVIAVDGARREQAFEVNRPGFLGDSVS
jgi:hypothetical protein